MRNSQAVRTSERSTAACTVQLLELNTVAGWKPYLVIGVSG